MIPVERLKNRFHKISWFVVGLGSKDAYDEIWRVGTLLGEMVRRDRRARVSGAAMGRFWLIWCRMLFALAYFMIFVFISEPKLPALDGREPDKIAFLFFLLAGLLPIPKNARHSNSKRRHGIQLILNNGCGRSTAC